MPVYWSWAGWLSPLTYALRGLALNEFTAPHWTVTLNSLDGDAMQSQGQVLDVGRLVLRAHELPAGGGTGWWVWGGLVVLAGFWAVANVITCCALSSLGRK